MKKPWKLCAMVFALVLTFSLVAGLVTTSVYAEDGQYTIQFAGGDGVGTMDSVTPNASEDYTLPKSRFVSYGQNFDHWSDGTNDYADAAVIPANTYAENDEVTLTAVYVDRDKSVTMEDGSFEFTIRGGEKATFEEIPAGTAYQVYEMTPDGWVLVQQSNSSGMINSLEESAAEFYNRYQPGVTTVQFSGVKTLDGRAAPADQFAFELVENDEVIDTVYTMDGGFIQFHVITYDKDMVGEHVYTIREVDLGDDTIDYDKHVETVTVNVIDNGDGTLSNTVIYDDDGIRFVNTTRPGVLKITKYTDYMTEANQDDEFTFEITFYNENGTPFNDDIYWYIED